jgi:hypothetical protein
MTRRIRVAVTLLALVVPAALVATTAPGVPAAPPRPVTEAARVAPPAPVYRTDGVDGRFATTATQFSGAQVWDLQVVGTTIYVAGKFTRVVEAGGTWPRRDQPFLAAFDTVTGRWRSQWAPRVNRPVYALERLPSGAILAAGEFTEANGAAAEGLVALDPNTGATDLRFRAGVRRPGSPLLPVIRDLDRHGRWLYAVGNFGLVVGPAGGSLPVANAMRVDATTGVPDFFWRPRLVGRSAHAVAVSADGRRVHLGGEFSSANGVPGTSQLATVNVHNGAVLRRWNHGSNAVPWPTWPVGGVVYDLDVYRNSLYVAGAEHFWERRNSRTGRSIRFQRISNDGQTVEVVGRRIYIGCHCFHRDPVHQVWEINARTGRALRGRTAALQSGDGTWATAVARDGCLWLGGDFNQATRVVGLGTGSFWVGRLARLCRTPPTESAPLPETADGAVNPPWWRAATPP